MIAVLVGFAGAAAGWWARGAWLRKRVTVRPVVRPDTVVGVRPDTIAGRTIVGWRTHLGRLSLGPLRERREDATRHADKIRAAL